MKKRTSLKRKTGKAKRATTKAPVVCEATQADELLHEALHEAEQAYGFALTDFNEIKPNLEHGYLSDREFDIVSDVICRLREAHATLTRTAARHSTSYAVPELPTYREPARLSITAFELTQVAILLSDTNLPVPLPDARPLQVGNYFQPAKELLQQAHTFLGEPPMVLNEEQRLGGVRIKDMVATSAHDYRGVQLSKIKTVEGVKKAIRRYCLAMRAANANKMYCEADKYFAKGWLPSKVVVNLRAWLCAERRKRAKQKTS